MNSLPLFFSSPIYYENYNFVRLMRNWNKYEEYIGEDTEEMMAEWEEWLLRDFLDGAREWLGKNTNSKIWRFGLE